jgi:hypothetical protein
MSHSSIRQSAALLALAALLGSPPAAFDTYWHSQCSRKVGGLWWPTAGRRRRPSNGAR